MFARLVAGSDDAGQIADVAVSIWRDVAAALAPIIGQSGVTALLKRSIHLTRAAHPCLSAANDGALPTNELAMLQAVLSQQDRIEAIATNAALLQHFHEVLITLIGASLTERLLRPVWDITSRGDAVPEAIT
ncbi:MAG: hypothetical protein EPN69_08640 [Rhodanobacter sp.]|nr:MAG: hypothetical protein EPN69_08640 [Rhodanobacter sp.]TAL96626.1 MAG: hypothetical protein EPN71_09300 [Rhodanobacter sp.]TAM40515.1 MAG: hypothetical protein EPN58_09900 [Rhodanobacter sp.]TAN28590.1 MAG: hypothetical protein EPN32_02735 [Rhodanobacter sp.]